MTDLIGVSKTTQGRKEIAIAKMVGAKQGNNCRSFIEAIPLSRLTTHRNATVLAGRPATETDYWSSQKTQHKSTATTKRSSAFGP